MLFSLVFLLAVGNAADLKERDSSAAFPRPISFYNENG
jgi:hypothetical protein